MEFALFASLSFSLSSILFFSICHSPGVYRFCLLRTGGGGDSGDRGVSVSLVVSIDRSFYRLLSLFYVSLCFVFYCVIGRVWGMMALS